MARTLAGTRIREVRRRTGLTQSALAKAAGISPSYLNLIEHNRRSAAGKVLLALANALDTKPSDLSDSGNSGLVAELREAISPDTPREPPEEFIGRFPYWSRQTARLYRRTRDQTQTIAALTDRLAQDPYISENIHGLLSNITAIRSTASILAQTEAMPHDQAARFHDTLHSESVRLSTHAEGLADYLAGSANTSQTPVTPEEAFDQFLEKSEYSFPQIDSLAEEGLIHASTIAELAELSKRLAEDVNLPAGEARHMVAEYLNIYTQDALDLPLDSFHISATECGFDPVKMSSSLNRPIEAILRRLAVLRRPTYDVPEFGLIISTASGHPLYRRPLPGFPMPRHGNACTLWPLFAALSQSERPLLATLEHDDGQRFTTVSYAYPHISPGLRKLPDMRCMMLIVGETQSPFQSSGIEISAGTTCRLCSRQNCASRSEQPIIQ